MRTAPHDLYAFTFASTPCITRMCKSLVVSSFFLRTRFYSYSEAFLPSPGIVQSHRILLGSFRHPFSMGKPQQRQTNSAASAAGTRSTSLRSLYCSVRHLYIGGVFERARCFQFVWSRLDELAGKVDEVRRCGIKSVTLSERPEKMTNAAGQEIAAGS